MKFHHRSIRFGFVLLALSVALASTGRAGDRPGAPDADALARQILTETGVQGGLVVHVGCGDGELTAALGSGSGFIVHGLAASDADVARARKHIRSRQLQGRVTVERRDGSRLPYAEDVVNLLVVEGARAVPEEEILRVLAPAGVATIRDGERRVRKVKPWPASIDEWTHFLHDPSGNAVARDRRAGPPRRMQWVSGPVWSRNHHTLASISAVVSAGGRVFYIVDQGSTASLEAPPRWSITARDAFSGVFLWRRSIPEWAYHRRKFRSGPVQLPRTLVAGAGRVYLPLGISAAVSALDAATGRIIATFGETAAAEEILLDGDVLLVVTGSGVSEQASVDPGRQALEAPPEKSIVAARPESGEVLWKRTLAGAARPVPLTLAAAGGRIFFQAEGGVVCLDRETGKTRWNVSLAPGGGGKAARRAPGWSVATLVVNRGVVLSADGRKLRALSAGTGEELWECETRAGFRSPVDVFVVDGIVWYGPDFAEGRDLRSGDVKRTSDASRALWTAGHHPRCYRNKATERFIVTGKRGIEFLDLTGDRHSRNNWIRGVCQYGVLPSNGLIYAPPDACGCYMEAKLNGFWALAPDAPPATPGDARRLERGLAHGAIGGPGEIPDAADWPMHRHDPRRSGSTAARLPSRLEPRWQAEIGGRLTATVIVADTAVVASIDEHRVVALDAPTGTPRWTFTAGGRVDSPPTIDRGRVLFGSADGRVYCLRLADGALAWRFRAAPEERKAVASDQLESVWPVHGSVLVKDGVAYVSAGRSSYLDGGLYFYGLDPETGEILCQARVLDEPATARHTPRGDDGTILEAQEKIDQNRVDAKTTAAPDRSDGFSMNGLKTDLLVSDGTSIFMRHLGFTGTLLRQDSRSRHLFSTSRLLDDAESHRSHWVLGGGDFRRLPVAYSWIANRERGRKGVHLAVPYGLMLSFDDATVWGVRRIGGYRLFARRNDAPAPAEEARADFRKLAAPEVPENIWTSQVPLRPRAMLRAGDLLVLGGMPLATTPEDTRAAHAGEKGGILWIASTGDGKELARYDLPSPPVWDGLSVARERLYVSLQDGRLVCLAPGP